MLLCGIAYFVAYKRERGQPLTQFSTRALLVTITLAAIEAWAWRAGQGELVFVILASGSLLFWRVWERRHESLSWLSLLVLAILAILFVSNCLLFAVWMGLGPEVWFDMPMPVTEPKQDITMGRLT